MTKRWHVVIRREGEKGFGRIYSGARVRDVLHSARRALANEGLLRRPIDRTEADEQLDALLQTDYKTFGPTALKPKAAAILGRPVTIGALTGRAHRLGLTRKKSGGDNAEG